MKSHLSLFLVMLSIVLGGFVSADSSEDLTAPAAVNGWIVRPSDNICGIADARKISNPAKVDYEQLFESTPEIKEMRRQRIDPNSARGKQLRRAANELITKAAELVRRAGGHCGVWKAIRHTDRRTVPNITDDVLSRF